MSDHDEHAEARAEGSAESSPSSTSTCGLSSDFADDVMADAARGSDVLLHNVMESVSGALGWFFAQEEGGAASAIEAAVEEGGGEVQDDAAEEAPEQTRIDENTIPPPPPPPANAEVEADEHDKASTPTKAAVAAPITSEDTVIANSSASSDNSNNKKEQRSAWPRSRTKLVGIVSVGLVLIIAIVVGAVIGASGSSGQNASVERLQGAKTQNIEEGDSYPSENDGAGGVEAVVPTAPVQQSPLPTDRPSLRPTPASADYITSIEADPLPVDDSPVEAVDDIPTSISFYVLGDVPYNPNQKIIVEDQILHLSEDIVDEDLFLIHVGDAMNAKQGCNEKDFVFMRDLLTSGLPELPSFIIPGDNDWNDCPSRSAAWKLWEKHFMAFENNWNGTAKFAPFQGSAVQRQSIREENFSFLTHGVLFFSLHWLGGGKDSRTADRMADNDAWIEEQVQKHGESISSGRTRAVVIFSHALTKSDLSQNSLQLIRNSFERYDVPVLLFKGDKHSFEICDSFLGMGVGWDNFKIVQVDQGGNAPPIRVSILGEGMSSASPSDSNATIPLADFIHLDRRGGLYSWAPTDQLPNACGAVSRGEVY